MRWLVGVVALVACSSSTTTPTTPPSTIGHAVAIPDAPIVDAAPAKEELATVFGGPRHVCGILASGRVMCWGSGRDGQLGDGSEEDRVTPTLVPGLANVTALALGEKSTCALLRDHTVWCWGSNDGGQLGDGTMTPHGKPAQVPGLGDVAQIVTASAHVCARLRTGKVRCWGENDGGQLGDGTRTNRADPTTVPNLADVVQIAAGATHTCARLAVGTIRCWGSNDLAQLGIPGRPISALALTPELVPNIRDAVDLVAGLNHTCVRFGDGTISCWGWDEECQLGFVSSERCISKSPCKAAPTKLPLTDVVEISLSAMHSCVRHANGTVTCWGDDPRQFLPDNTVDASVPRLCKPTPTTFTDAAQVALYWGGTCSLARDHSLACFGSNWFGELGDGTKQAHPDPAPVAF